MKFEPSPPYAPFCDYNINITDCHDEKVYFFIYSIGAAIHFLILFWGVYIVIRYGKLGDNDMPFIGSLGDRMRHFVSQPLRPASIFSALFIMCRLVHNTLCAFDLIPSLEGRTISNTLSMLPGFWATLFFAVGIVETVQLTVGRLPNNELSSSSSSSSHSNELATRHHSTRVVALAALAVLGIVGTIVPTVFSVLAGLRGKIHDWIGYHFYLQISWCTLGSVFVALGVLYIYYAVILSRLLRRLTPKLLQSSQEPQPLYDNFSASSTTRVDNGSQLDVKPINVLGKSAHIVSTNKPKDKSGPKFATLYKFAFRDKSSINSNASFALREAQEAETKERAGAIHRLQSALRHLIVYYCAGAIGSYLWGLGAHWLIVTPIVNKLSAVVFLVIIWPLAAGSVFWHRWQMERARIRREKRRIGMTRTVISG
ncbi:hypothetical protein BDF22DRAFT_682713 [Syncephalis plumigaleata]|nr:hypothetical protein BDF22DRAFT_682713 [Syncephalis plumigaleata]